MSSLPPEPTENPFSTPSIAASVSGYQPQISLEQYSTVRLGLQLIYYSIAAIALLAIVMAVILFGSLGMMSGAGPGIGLMSIFGLMTLGLLGGLVTILVGFCMCGACPNPNEKTLAFTTIACFIFNLGASFLGDFATGLLPDASGILIGGAIQLAGTVANITCSITFCLLLKRIGKNISSPLMENSAHRALVWFLSLIGCVFFLVVGSIFTGMTSGPGGQSLAAVVGIIFGIALLVVGLGSLFQFLAMLRNGINELKPA